MVRVVVVGAAGRLGRALATGIAATADLDLVGAVDPSAAGVDVAGVTIVGSLGEVMGDVDVVLLATTAGAVATVATDALSRGAHVVLGSSGVATEVLDALGRTASERGLGFLVVPNFALGAVLLLRFAAVAARYFPSVEVVELHHPNKADAPSGTATHTLEVLAAARADAGMLAPPDATSAVSIEGSRGGVGPGGIHVHSIRLTGLVAHEELLFGGEGEQLTLRHDSFDRTSFVAGACLAVRSVSATTGLSVGLDQFLS